jgi:hypothetical protein
MTLETAIDIEPATVPTYHYNGRRLTGNWKK